MGGFFHISLLLKSEYAIILTLILIRKRVAQPPPIRMKLGMIEDE
jgi:hypothetical protein